MPRLALLALVLGLLIGFIRQGRLYRLGENVPRAWPLLPLGAALSLLTGYSALPFGHYWVLLALVYLVAFCLINIKFHWFMALAAAGIGLNLVVIALNHGMPVDPAAAQRAHLTTDSATFEPEGFKHHRETSSDTLSFLGDNIAVPGLREVVSIGDIIFSIGIAGIAMRLLLPNPHLMSIKEGFAPRQDSRHRAQRRSHARRRRRRVSKTVRQTDSLEELDLFSPSVSTARVREDLQGMTIIDDDWDA